MIVPELNQAAAYLYCPLCRQNGNPKVMMSRENHQFKCPVNLSHILDWNQMMALNADKVQLADVMQEQPDSRCMSFKIFLIPETWQDFQKKFAGRVWITIGTLFSAMVSDELFIITGPDAAALRAKGLKNSAQVLASLDSNTKLEQERDQAKEQLERLMGLIKEAQASGG